MNDDELREQLQGAVPDAPDPAGWAVTARTAARRRTAGRWATAGVGVALVAVVGALLWPFGPGDPQVAVPAASPSATASSVPPSNPDCAELTDSSPGGLREGIVRISLCPRTDGPTFTTPFDSLTTGINDVVRDIAALPAETSVDPDCSSETDRRYLVVFTGSAGNRTTMEAATPNACGVKPGSANYRRWNGLLTVLRDAWTAQRATQSAPNLTVGCLPYDRPGLFSPRMADLEQAAVCMTDSTTGDVQFRAPMTPELSKAIIDGVTRYATRGQNIDSRRDGAVLTLAGPWGDPLVFWRVEGDQWFAFVPDGGTTQVYWDPDPGTEGVLTYLLQNAPTPTPTQTSSDDRYLPPVCRGLSPTFGPIPTAAARLRLCPAGNYSSQVFTPLDTVDGERALAVLRVLNSRQPLPTPAACTADFGPDFLLVAESDGAPPVAMVLQLYGCRVAGTADDQRQAAADAVLDEFRTQLTAQRDAGRRAVLERAGSRCGAFVDNATSVMPVTPVDAISVTFCRYSATDHSTARETRLSDDHERPILADIDANSEPAAAESCANWPPRQSVSRFALTTMHGDVLLLTETCTGGYAFVDGTQQRQWTPSEDVAKLVARLANG